MKILFSNPALLPLVVLLTIPVLIHLFAKTRPPRYAFSSITFILRIVRSSMRIKRPQNWLMLLLRSILFALILLLFLQPVFFAAPDLASPFKQKNIVIIIDSSASMSYRDGAQSRFTAACAEASEILEGLTSHDTANIIWLNANPINEFPDMGINHSFLQQQLRKASVSDQAADIQTSINKALKLLESTDGKKEICIISDFQAEPWITENIVLPPNIKLIKIQVGKTNGSNTAITGIQYYPPQPLIGEAVTLSCNAVNYSDKPKQITVFLSAGESRHTQNTVLAPHSEYTATFRHKFITDGITILKASITEDQYPGDNQYWKLINIKKKLTIGLLDNDKKLAGRWLKALQAFSWTKAEIISDNELNSDLAYDVLLLAGWKGNNPEILKQLAASGTTVICSPDRNSAFTTLHKFTVTKEATQPPVQSLWEKLPQPVELKITDNDDNIFKLFANGEFGDLSRGLFSGRLRLTKEITPPGKILLSYTDNIPALIRINNYHNFYIWNLPLDKENSNWADQMEFLPFLGELLLNSRQFSDNLNAMNGPTGRQLQFNNLNVSSINNLSLYNDESKKFNIITKTDNTGILISSKEFLPPGVYTLKYSQNNIAFRTVNFPAVESDLTLLKPQELQEKETTVITSGRKVRYLRDGLKLWPYLLFAAISLALLEGIILFRLERIKK